MDFEFKEYPYVGLSGPLCHGYVMYCNFGVPHLFCKVEHIPDDPALPLPMVEMTLVTGYYAERFIDKLHPWLNPPNLLNNVYRYVTSSVTGANSEKQRYQTIVDALYYRRCVLIRLVDPLEVAKERRALKQLQKSDKTQSAKPQKIPGRTSGADLPAPPQRTITDEQAARVRHSGNLRC